MDQKRTTDQKRITDQKRTETRKEPRTRKESRTEPDTYDWIDLCTESDTCVYCIIPAATVSFVPSSIRTRLPVVLFVI
jgi:hypothetical protein